MTPTKKTMAIDAIYSALANCNTHPDAELSRDLAATQTLASLAIDSLDLVQVAMDVEEQLDLEIDVAMFRGELTIEQIAADIIKN